MKAMYRPALAMFGTIFTAALLMGSGDVKPLVLFHNTLDAVDSASGKSLPLLAKTREAIAMQIAIQHSEKPVESVEIAVLRSTSK